MSSARIALCLLAVITAVTAAPRSRISARIDDSRRVHLAGHLHPSATEANDVGPVDPSQPLSGLTVVLKAGAEQEADLLRLLDAQQEPTSPNYHHWLTPEEYADRFGASQEDIDKIMNWLTQHNLQVTSVARSRNAIRFSGAVGDIDNAFGTELRQYRVNGARHFANAGAPTIPTALDVVISGIQGLNDFRMKPHSVQRRSSVQAEYTSASGNHYLSPSDIQTIYGVKALHASGYTGSGQTIVVPGQSRIDLADIAQFRTRFNLPASAPDTLLVPGTRDPGTVTDDMAESHLDVEWAGATAPDAKVLFVYSANVMDAVQYAIDNKLGSVISLSYGSCEPLTPRSDALTMQAWARQANAQGMTWVNASGDSGGADCVTSKSTRGAGLSVDLPAAVPEVTGVGGTSFIEGGGNYWNATNDTNGASVTGYIPEAAWNDSTAGDPSSGGGGASTYFLKPAWQTGAGVPADGARSIPDVSFNASADHDGYLVYTSGKLQVYGGTSAAAPVFAGMLALLNQYLVSTGAQTVAGLGNINPKLYSLAQTSPAAFHDVQSGNNIVAVTCSATATRCTSGSFGYDAGVAYDLATGLGSVDAYNLVTSWRSQTSAIAKSSVLLKASASTTTVSSTGQFSIDVSVTSAFGTPTGSVSLLSGITTLASAGLNDSGTATLALNASQLVSGTNGLTLSYTGDSAFNPASTTLNITVTSTTSGGAPAIAGTADAASFRQRYAPGMILSIFGSNLASTTWSVSALPLPTQASDVTVTISGIAAPLYYVSPTQLNVQIPFEVTAGTNALLTVSRGGRTATTRIPVISAAPAIFTDQSGFIVPAASVSRGQTATLYVTGQGAVTPRTPTGAAPAAGTASANLPQPVQSVRVSIDGFNAPVQFAGIPAGLVGLAQINFTVPTQLSAGNHTVIVSIGGVSSATASLNVR